MIANKACWDLAGVPEELLTVDSTRSAAIVRPGNDLIAAYVPGTRQRRHSIGSEASTTPRVDIVEIMASTPLRDIPADVMQHYTARAQKEGISRNALLVPVLTDAARRDTREPLTLEHLQRSAERTADLGDREVIDGAWS